MRITAHIERTKKTTTVSLPDKSTVKNLLAKLSLNPVTVLVTRKGHVILEDQLLRDHDDIKILSVVSGG